ncbi:conserved Plasmodium protein, unknown function [Plasmodium ovale]|uniref:Uncharacterized protein n=1 Tax=Plasmodium ovale TaxID=36330 RepID=A0A1D3TKJ1_PLAOA|nr:conserved Plasmodium protein, unknown function [Plasmodium ovale]
MTDFREASTCIEEMGDICSELLNAKEEEMYTKLSLYYELEEKLKKVQPIITRIRLRRNEKDEKKKIYGEKMLKSVDILLERYDILYNIYEEELTVFKENYEINKNKKMEEILLQEKEKKKYEQELLNRGRKKTKMEEEEIQKKNLEKLKIMNNEKEQYEKRIHQMEIIKKAIHEKCNFLYEEISAACNREEAIKYIYTQLGSPVSITADVSRDDNDERNERDSLIDCLYLIYRNNEFGHFKEALKNIIQYMEELVKNIDSEQLKLINLMNTTFQRNILSKKGTLFVFILIGYVIKKADDISHVLKKVNRDINKENVYIYLEEPDIASDYEKWKNWFESIQSSLNIVCTVFRHINKYSDPPDEETVKSIFLYLKRL